MPPPAKAFRGSCSREKKSPLSINSWTLRYNAAMSADVTGCCMHRATAPRPQYHKTYDQTTKDCSRNGRKHNNNTEPGGTNTAGRRVDILTMSNYFSPPPLPPPLTLPSFFHQKLKRQASAPFFSQRFYRKAAPAGGIPSSCQHWLTGNRTKTYTKSRVIDGRVRTANATPPPPLPPLPPPLVA